MTGPTLSTLYRSLKARFAEAGLGEPAADARILLAGLLDLDPTIILTDPERAVAPADLERIEDVARRRLAHEPVHRIFGRREFYGLDLRLSGATLEPRPDTEILVDRLLPYLQRIVAVGKSPSIIDFGTGTGAIALALLAACPEATAVGVDISPEAVETARDNAARLSLGDRFTAFESDWASAVTDRYDVVVSNPPYIVRSVLGELSLEVRLHDPEAALDGGEDGLDAYRALATVVPGCLAEGGTVGLEIGYDQRETVSALFERSGFVLEEAVKDYGGNDRVLIFSARA